MNLDQFFRTEGFANFHHQPPQCRNTSCIRLPWAVGSPGRLGRMAPAIRRSRLALLGSALAALAALPWPSAWSGAADEVVAQVEGPKS